MMQILKDLTEPSEFWEYFEIIATIPRCSGNEKQIREYIKNEVNKFGYESQEDNVGNLVVKIPSSSEKPKRTIVLQCHLDMVCEKNENIEHDFKKDAIPLQIIEIQGEKWLTAKGTTLGADNGVGIAYILTIMKKIHEKNLQFKNIALEMLFTVDEEVGLVGAFNLNNHLITGDLLINLDSEEDDTFIIGCAGGINTYIEIGGNPLFLISTLEDLIPLRISIENLIGGHSGVDIHKGRGNALQILAKILTIINQHTNLELISFEGGRLPNAIPREANSVILIPKDEEFNVKNLITKVKEELQDKYATTEPDLNIVMDDLPKSSFYKIVKSEIKNKLLNTFDNLPNGPIRYDPKSENLVHTSTNLASINIKNNRIKIITSQRSLNEDSKKEIYEKIESFFKKFESCTINHLGDYPGWTPNWNSKLLKSAKETYQKLFNKGPKIQVIHAGLECGILKTHFPQMDTISIGPTIVNPHSPKERLKVESIPKIWTFLHHLLEYYI
ncbi:MAG: beta-Ala-His dipeptidase [Promethearchaeota archaeon]